MALLVGRLFDRSIDQCSFARQINIDEFVDFELSMNLDVDREVFRRVYLDN